MRQALAGDRITIIRSVHYHQYDTYFFFDDPTQGRLRYREDEFLDEQHNVVNARARLTLTGLSREAAFGSVLLFRSRFIAPATHTPRFYRDVLQANIRARGRQEPLALAGRVPRRPVLRPCRPHEAPPCRRLLPEEVKSRTWVAPRRAGQGGDRHRAHGAPRRAAGRGGSKRATWSCDAKLDCDPSPSTCRLAAVCALAAPVKNRRSGGQKIRSLSQALRSHPRRQRRIAETGPPGLRSLLIPDLLFAAVAAAQRRTLGAEAGDAFAISIADVVRRH